MQNLLQKNIDLLLNGLVSNDEDVTREAIFAMKRSQWAEKSILDSTFSALIEVLASNVAQRSKHTSFIVYYFESSFKFLDFNQKKQLLSLIESRYDSYKDWMVQFSFSEILGEKFSNLASLNVVKRLNRRTRGQFKLFIPHAFEHHATNSHSTLVKAIALNELKKLQFRQPTNVVREAKISLRRVNQRKNIFVLKHIKK